MATLNKRMLYTIAYIRLHDLAHAPTILGQSNVSFSMQGYIEACKETVEFLKSPKRTDFLTVFWQRQDAASKEGDKELAELMKLFRGVFSMYFQFAKGEPFGPLMSGPGGRTLMPQDLTEKELVDLEEVLAVSSNAQVVARISDVLWIRRRKHSYAQQAVRAYLKAVDEDTDESWVPKSQWLKRAAQIAAELGTKAPERGIVKKKLFELFEESRKKCFTPDFDYWPSAILEIILENDFADDWNELGDKSVEIAKGFSVSQGCETTRTYYQHAIKCYQNAGQPAKVNQIKLAIAKDWESETRSFQPPSGCDGLNLADRLEKTIQAYRDAGNSKKAEELVHELKQANKFATSQMKVISIPSLSWTSKEKTACQQMFLAPHG